MDTFDVDGLNWGLLVLRVGLGLVVIAHGYNHIFGGGKIEGTAAWFESLGMRPGKLHAWLASLTELGAGAMLVAGLLTPFAAAGVVAVMFVALVTNHLKNGFFIFRPGEGYEYVLTLSIMAIALGATGAGEWSLDEAIDVHIDGWAGFLIALVLGVGMAALTLLVYWRPERESAESQAES